MLLIIDCKHFLLAKRVEDITLPLVEMNGSPSDAMNSSDTESGTQVTASKVSHVLSAARVCLCACVISSSLSTQNQSILGVFSCLRHLACVISNTVR